MKTKTFIIDALSNEFYAIHREKFDCVSDNDHPYWTNNIYEAYDFTLPGFSSHQLAANEMNANDLTDAGTRQPKIINAREDEDGNIVWKAEALRLNIESIKQTQELNKFIITVNNIKCPNDSARALKLLRDFFTI
jgi:hypothetical protein